MTDKRHWIKFLVWVNPSLEILFDLIRDRDADVKQWMFLDEL